MVTAAWMFDAIPWNPWVFWPIVAIPSLGFLLVFLGGLREPPPDHIEGVDNALISLGMFLAVVVPVVWIATMFFVNLELENRSEWRDTRDACFAIMDAYAERVGDVDSDIDPAGFMGVFLELPLGDQGVGDARASMESRGCRPSDLADHLSGWEAKAAAEAERSADEEARRQAHLKFFDDAGGPAVVLDATKSLQSDNAGAAITCPSASEC